MMPFGSKFSHRLEEKDAVGEMRMRHGKAVGADDKLVDSHNVDVDNPVLIAARWTAVGIAAHAVLNVVENAKHIERLHINFGSQTDVDKLVWRTEAPRVGDYRNAFAARHSPAARSDFGDSATDVSRSVTEIRTYVEIIRQSFFFTST